MRPTSGDKVFQLVTKKTVSLLGGFWGLFFNSILPQNSDGDFVSGNHKKKFLVIRKFFAYQKWQFKNSNLHYMLFFQSCSILTFYSLKWSSQWVGSEKIYVRGYLIYCLGDTASDRVQKGHFGLGSHFGPYQRWYHPNSISNTPQHIYFLNLLIERVILSYKTLKSNNFEKMTYNANLNF